MIILDKNMFLFVFSIILQGVISLYILRKMMWIKMKRYCLLFFVLLHPFFVMYAVFFVETTNIFLILCGLGCYILFWRIVVDKNINVRLFYTLFALCLTFYVKECVIKFILNGVFDFHQVLVNTDVKSSF